MFPTIKKILVSKISLLELRKVFMKSVNRWQLSLNVLTLDSIYELLVMTQEVTILTFLPLFSLATS